MRLAADAAASARRLAANRAVPSRPKILPMSAEQLEIILVDGPRASERIMIESGPDGGAPRKITLTDPPAEPLVVPPGTTCSTSYWRVDVKREPQDATVYQSGIRAS